MKYVFAGDRDLSVEILRHLIETCGTPSVLMVSGDLYASHSEALVRLSGLEPSRVFRGKDFCTELGMETLRSCAPDYIIGIHFPHIIPKDVLAIPAVGVLNLHPAFLPFNRGWHTPSWAILDGTPVGATLHFMSDGIDTGDIVHQRQMIIRPEHTADSLYQELKRLEVEVFKEALPSIRSLNPPRRPQNVTDGTSHRRQDLFRSGVQEIFLTETTSAGSLLQKLRALTTNAIGEAAFFHLDGMKYRVQVNITPETTQTEPPK